MKHCILSTFPSPVKKNHRHFTRVGFGTRDLCNSRAVSYQLATCACDFKIFLIVIIYYLFNINAIRNNHSALDII